jgi:hypothetical protein
MSTPERGVDRRSFLKGAATVAVGGTAAIPAAAAALQEAAAPPGAALLGPGPVAF